MPYQVDWYIPQRIIRITLRGQVSQEDVLQAIAALYPLIEAGHPPLYLFSDEMAIEKVNVNVVEIREVFKVATDPRVAHAVILAKNNPLLNFLALVVGRLVAIEVQRFDNREALHQFLQGLDPTLDFSQAVP